MVESSDREPEVEDSLLKGSIFWTATSHAAPFLLTILTSVVAARILTPDEMGRQSFIAFVILAVLTFTTTSLSYALSREVGDHLGAGRAGAVRSVVDWGWIVIGLGSIAGAVVMLAAASFGSGPFAAWVLAAVAVLAGGLNRVPGAVIEGARQWRSQSMMSLWVMLGWAVATLGALAAGWGITGMVAATAGASIGLLVGNGLLMRSFLRTLPSARIARPPDVRTTTFRFALTNTVPVVLGLFVLQRSEVFFLNHYSADAQIANYSIAYSAVLALAAVPSAVRTFVLPSVATLLGASEHARIRRGYSRLIRLSFLATVPLTAMALAVGPNLIDLVYGTKYSGAGTVLALLVIQLPLVPLTVAAGSLLMGYGTTRVATAAYAAAAAVDIGLAALLVPSADATGAAIANVTAVAVLAAVMLPYSARLVGGVHVGWRDLALLTVTSAVAAAAAIATLGGRDTGVVRFFLALGAGTAALILVSVILRPVAREDGEWLSNLAPLKMHRHVARAVNRISRPSPRLTD